MGDERFRCTVMLLTESTFVYHAAMCGLMFQQMGLVDGLKLTCSAFVHLTCVFTHMRIDVP